ncbi:rhodanese-like domain-containing protein [uncultured Tateyamaria sp.]|uniref:rhodanese-like domain-containing protein n=1 Tax=uncultured Tateyamaria sp. TaxID=455651 RepID=UPI0026177FF8|nr:rhodanese-like domain-containing protein [uncultured Tateyamaria sp.]
MDHTHHSISATELLSVLGTGRAPRLIDVCVPEDSAAAPWRLPGARHVPHRSVLNWARSQDSDAPVVIICQKGLKLSHGAAAQLRSMGFDARALTGGNHAWRTDGRPHLALDTAPDPGTSWVLPATHDARACITAWLILRWYDPDAALLWVTPKYVIDVAMRFDGNALPNPMPLGQAFVALGLICPDLVDFITAVDTGAFCGAALLAMLPNLHERDEDLARAALPFLDTAWLVHRQSAGQEAT